MRGERWLGLVGIGEDGIDGLIPAARQLIAQADFVVGGKRHLALAGSLEAETMTWPSPIENALDAIEERLFKLRAIARKHRVPVSELAALHKRFQDDLASLETGAEQVQAAKKAAAAAAASPPPLARALATAALACSGSIFWRNESFCEAIKLPLILSFPVV